MGAAFGVLEFVAALVPPLANRAASRRAAADAEARAFFRAFAVFAPATASMVSSVLLSFSARWSARLFSFLASRAGRVASRLVDSAVRCGATEIPGSVLATVFWADPVRATEAATPSPRTEMANAAAPCLSQVRLSCLMSAIRARRA